jgi:hypothetical protein
MPLTASLNILAKEALTRLAEEIALVSKDRVLLLALLALRAITVLRVRRNNSCALQAITAKLIRPFHLLAFVVSTTPIGEQSLTLASNVLRAISAPRDQLSPSSAPLDTGATSKRPTIRLLVPPTSARPDLMVEPIQLLELTRPTAMHAGPVTTAHKAPCSQLHAPLENSPLAPLPQLTPIVRIAAHLSSAHGSETDSETT